MRLPFLAASFCLIATAIAALPTFAQDGSYGVVESRNKFYYKDGEEVKSDWMVRGGGGVFMGPEYEGSNDYVPIVVPYIYVGYKDTFFFDPFQGAGVNIIHQDGFRGGAKLSYRFGRDESDSSNLRGLGDVDDAIELGFFLEQTVPMQGNSVVLGLDVMQDISNAHDGMIATASTDYVFNMGPQMTPSLGVSTAYADDDYMESFFGVNAAQSARSGLPAFGAGSGFKDVALNAKLNWAFNPEWAVMYQATYKQLIGDAESSPITGRGSDEQWLGGVFVVHAF